MTAAAIDAPQPRRRPGALARLLRQPLGAAGLLIVAAFVAAALLAPVLPLSDPDLAEPARRLVPPLSGAGPLGTDLRLEEGSLPTREQKRS